MKGDYARKHVRRSVLGGIPDTKEIGARRFTRYLSAMDVAALRTLVEPPPAREGVDERAVLIRLFRAFESGRIPRDLPGCPEVLGYDDVADWYLALRAQPAPGVEGITDADRIQAIQNTVAATESGVHIHDATPDWSVVVVHDGEVCGQGRTVREALDKMVRDDRLVTAALRAEGR